MNIQTEFARAVRVVGFDKKEMKSVAHDKDIKHYTLLFVGLSSLASVLAYWLFPVQSFDFVQFRPDLTWVFSRFILSYVVSLFSLYFVGYVAEELFRSKLKAEEYFRVGAYSSVLGILMILPLFGIITSLWSIALLWVIFKEIAELKNWESILMVLIYFILFAILTGIATGFSL